MSDSSSELSRSRKPYWLGLIMLLALAAGFYLWLGRENGQAPQANGPVFGRGAMSALPVPVKVANAEVALINHTLKAIGTVTAFKTVTVRSRVDGELQQIAFDEGQKVQAGDLLAQIDPRNYQVALDQALGQQKQNEAQLKNAQRDLERYQLLYKQNSIARQQVDAQAALVQQLLGTRKSDQAAVDSAKLQLSFTQITAPITGRLGLRKIDEGNMVNASNTDGIVTITQTQPISVLFTLPQAQLPDVITQLRAGKTLAVHLYGSDDITRIATGTLESVDNQIDVATGTVTFKARFANEDESLFPNQFVNVRLHVDTAQSLAIPTLAVQQGSRGAFVYVVDENNKVRIQTIITGRIDEKRIAVVSGLSAGQRVVTEGVDRLREGSTVEVVTAEDTVAPAVPATGAPRGSGSAGQHGAH